MRILLPILLLLFLTLHSLAAPPLQSATPADFYQFQLGDFQITALLDGVNPRNPAEIATDPERVKEHLERHRVEETVMASYNVFLVNTGSKLLLVDAGTGAMLGDNGGYLVDSLRAAGHQPEQIDAVLVTHFHPDHINGLVSVKFDWDQGAAAKRRRYFLTLADRDGWVIASPHISFPGLGRVIEEETGYRWIPVPYGTDF